MPEPEEGFIDVRFVLDRIPDEETYITRVERMGYMLPEGTSSADIHNLILGFWEYPREIVQDITEAFKGLPTKASNE
jgi:hypothetical protein